MSKKGTNHRVAVYWDFENIHASLMDRTDGEGAYRRHWGRHPELVKFGPIMAYAASLGQVVVRKAYADWNRLSCYKMAVLDSSLEPVLLFTRPGGKNSADMRLVADVIEDLARCPGITHVIVLSGDGDFVPLAQKVRLTGRQVIGIGVQGSTSAFWREACNVFRDYEAVIRGDQPSPNVVTCKPNARMNTSNAIATQQRAEKTTPAVPRTRTRLPERAKCVQTTPKLDTSLQEARETAGSQSSESSPPLVGKVNGHASTNLIRAQNGNGKPPSSSAPESVCSRYRQALKKSGFQSLDFAFLVRAAHCLSRILTDRSRQIATWSQLDSHLAPMLAEQGKRPTSQTIRWARHMLAQGPGFCDGANENGSKLPDAFNAEERLTKIAAAIVRLLRRAGHWPIEQAAVAEVLGAESTTFIETALARQTQPTPKPKPKVSLKAHPRNVGKSAPKPEPTLVGRLQTWLRSIGQHENGPHAANAVRKAQSLSPATKR